MDPQAGTSIHAVFWGTSRVEIAEGEEDFDIAAARSWDPLAAATSPTLPCPTLDQFLGGAGDALHLVAFTQLAEVVRELHVYGEVYQREWLV